MDPQRYWLRPLPEHHAAGGFSSLDPRDIPAGRVLFARALLTALPPDLPVSASRASWLLGAYHGAVYRAIMAGAHTLAAQAVRGRIRAVAVLYAATSAHGWQVMDRARADWRAYLDIPAPERLVPPGTPPRLVAVALGTARPVRFRVRTRASRFVRVAAAAAAAEDPLPFG